MLGAAQQEALLKLARTALVNAVTGMAPPEPDSNDLSVFLKEPRACFVTLRNKGELRGCIGNVVASKPLFEAVTNNAIGAARRDSRFPPVTVDELDDIHIELSILSEPKPLNYSSREALFEMLRPGRDGVLLTVGNRTATFLPQVWENLPDKEEFLARLCAKAGLEPAAWRLGDLLISTYEVQILSESDQPNTSTIQATQNRSKS